MRRLALMALVPVTALVATACAAGGGGSAIDTDFDPAVASQMDGWQTYAHAPLPPTRSGGLYNAEWETRIREVIDREMQARGFQLVTANPDFRVAYHAAMGTMDIRDATEAYGYRAGWYNPVSAQGQDRWMEGTFVLDIIRASNNTLAWRGAGQGLLGRDGSRQILQPRIDTAVRQILEQFPPSRAQADPGMSLR